MLYEVDHRAYTDLNIKLETEGFATVLRFKRPTC